VTMEPGSAENGYQFLARLRDLTSSLQQFGALRHAVRVGESVENDLLGRIAALLSKKPFGQKANDRSRLRMCAEVLRDTMKLMERDPAEVLDLQSMSKAAGLSPRTLQRAFQTEYGLCPQEWLRVERLNGVREDLIQNGNPITHTATRWGFFHLGRFSQYYRDLFGERPSETLARRNAIHGAARSEVAEAQLEQLAS